MNQTVLLMQSNNENQVKHRFSTGGDKEIQLNMEMDPENPAYSKHMAELFKEVSNSKPETIADFLICLNDINNLKY
jgi:hypothetical protein